MAKSNAKQVEKIGRIARAFSLKSATLDQAKESLNLKRLDKVNF